MDTKKQRMILPTLSSVVRLTYASMSSRYCLYFFLLLALSSCNLTVKKEAAVSPDYLRQIKDYKLYRSILIRNDSIRISYFRPENTEFRPGNTQFHLPVIVSVRNEQTGQSKEIHIYPNECKAHWNFENEQKSKRNRYSTSLFEREFLSAVNELNLNDKHNTANHILNEIMTSVLHCETLDISQLEGLEDTPFTGSNQEENPSTCEVRIQKNKAEIRKRLNVNGCFSIFYWDEENERVYEINYDNYRSHQVMKKLNLKVYRFSCMGMLLFM